jgi:DNA-binding response OmpR family regulator
MNEGPHILIVDDDREIRDLLSRFLRKHGMRIEAAADGREMQQAMATGHFDLIVLDLMLPGEDGLSLCRKIRSETTLPIIMLTALGEESDIVLGLHVGADDYMTKPFSMSVLVARIAALLRRSEPKQAEASEILSSGPIEIDTARHRVQIDGREITLTLTEFRLLAAIVGARGRVLQRDQLIDSAMGSDAIVIDRTIDVHMTSLRKKLGEARKYVQTVRGVGYKLAGEDGIS